MCGRFTQTKSRKEVLEELVGMELPPLFTGRYNVAPTQKVAVIKQSAPARAEECIWGFEHPQRGSTIINARCESLQERPMFHHLLAANRCLIPADGFYEWKGKQPYYFQLPDKHLFAFAGLWNNDRCVIITRSADENMRGIHHRMPVIFPIGKYHQWIESFHIPEAPPLTMRPVTRRVNAVANDNPACLEAPPDQGELF